MATETRQAPRSSLPARDGKPAGDGEAAEGNQPERGQAEKMTAAAFKRGAPDWCPGCGDFAILRGLQQAVAELNLPPHRIALVTGIGCSGKTSSFFYSYGFHGVHGRALPLATGIKVANPELTVVVVGGDGDGYSIGIGHLIHAARRNVDITYIVMDNRVYGLTKGQTSPTSLIGFETKTSPSGSVEEPIHPLALAIDAGATYVAQGFSGNVKQVIELIRQGIEHKGFALIDIFSPCVTYNKVNSYEWYREQVIDLQGDVSYDPTDRGAALEKVADWDHLYTGLLYREEKPTFEAGILRLAEGQAPPAQLDVSDPTDVGPLLDRFRAKPAGGNGAARGDGAAPKPVQAGAREG